VEQQPIQVGRRIAVWGVTGSGKTTLAQRLGETLGLGVVELDAIRHARGWDSTDWPEFREVLTERTRCRTAG
jgi:adenylate kinase family enzyme